MFNQNPFMAFRQRQMLQPSMRTQRFGADTPAVRPEVPMAPRQAPQPRDYGDELMDLQGQMGPGLQAYKEYLGRAPQREDYKPGWMTRIAAALSGVSAGVRDPGQGIAAAQGINESGYRNALQDYANEGVGLREQAGMEQDELESKIRALQNARAMGLKYDEFELKRLESSNKMRNDTTNAQAAMTRAEAYARSVNKPGYDATPQQDGSVLYINKSNPADTITVPAKTIAAGQLGVARQNANTNSRNANTAAGNLEVNRKRADSYDFSVRNPRPGVTRPPLPRIQQDAEDTALRQMMSDPLFKDFIGTDDNGYPMVVEDDGSEDYQDFLAALNAKVDEVLGGRSRRGGM